MSYSQLQLCSNKGAFEAIPNPKLHLDLGRAKERFENMGWPVLDARVMLILQRTPEVTLLRDGKMVIKTRAPEEAERAFQEVLRALALL